MKRLEEPEFLKRELKNVNYIADLKKVNWLARLNRALTEKQGKIIPYKFLLSSDLVDMFDGVKMNKSDATRKAFADLMEDRTQAAYYMSVMLIMWMWGINRVVHRIPVEVFKAANQNYDLVSVPIEPLLKLPQWTTCIAMDWEGVHKDDDGYNQCQRFMMYALVMLNGKEYLQIEVYTTRPDHEIVQGTRDHVTYSILIDTSMDNVKAGFDQALIDIPKNHAPEISQNIRVDDNDEMLYDLITMISLVNGEHRKAELGKTNVKWPGYQIQGTSGYKIRPRLKAVEFMVGEEYVPQLRQMGVSGERTQRKSHIRCGHWHTYWLGPRSGPRTQERYWLMPIVVSGKVSE